MVDHEDPANGLQMDMREPEVFPVSTNRVRVLMCQGNDGCHPQASFPICQLHLKACQTSHYQETHDGMAYRLHVWIQCISLSFANDVLILVH